VPRGGGIALVVDGPVLVLARDAAGARAALDRRARRAGLRRSAFAARVAPAGGTGPALVRAAAPARLLAGRLTARLPIARRLHDGALALRVAAPGIRARFAATTTATAPLAPADIPLAFGAAAPAAAAGVAPAALGLRDARHTLAVVRADRAWRAALPQLAPVVAALDAADRVPGVLRRLAGLDVDAALLDQLTGTTTVTRERSGAVVVRAELRDGGPLRTALGRLARVPDVALRLAGAADLHLGRAGAEAFTLRTGDAPALRLAVIGDVLVATPDARVGLRAVAHRAPRRPGTAGALHAALSGPAVRGLVVATLRLPRLAGLLLGPLGAGTVALRVEPAGLTGEATLALGR
jgi:hypothetical protein